MKRTVCAIFKVEKSLLRGDCCIGIKSLYISQNLNALTNSHLFVFFLIRFLSFITRIENK